MYLEYPVAYPIAKLLGEYYPFIILDCMLTFSPCRRADYLLGESHGTTYKKAELKTLVGIHGRAFHSAVLARPLRRLITFTGLRYRRGDAERGRGHHHLGGPRVRALLLNSNAPILICTSRLGGKSVSAIMTPIEDTYTLSSDAVLDREKVDEVGWLDSELCFES